MTTKDGLLPDGVESPATNLTDLEPDFELVLEEDNGVAVEDPQEEEEEEEVKAAKVEAPVEEEHDDDQGDDLEMDEEEKEDYVALGKPKSKRRFRNLIKQRNEARNVALLLADESKKEKDAKADIEAKYIELQHVYADTLEASIGDSITTKVAELRRAKEAQDYDTETKLAEEVSNLRFQANSIKELKTRLPAKIDPAARQTQSAPQATPQPQKRTYPLADKWVNTNKAWFNNKEFAVERAAVIAIDQQLVGEGYDPTTQAYYNELNKRVDTKFPSLRKPVTASQPVAPVTAPAVSAPSSVGKKTITLSASDFNTMRLFGLDPKNKQHCLEFARTRARNVKESANG